MSGPAIAALLTLAVLAGWLSWGRWLPLDVANRRSLHSGSVPRIGGAAIAAGCLGGLLLSSPADPVGSTLGTVLAAAAGLCLLSLADDWRSLPVLPRLAGHLAAATAVVVVLDLPGYGLPVLVLALVWAANLYNFMDGADGLAGAMALIGFGCYGLAAVADQPALAGVCFTLAAAAGGFLVYNRPPARVFMGDAGSVPLGFLAGGLGLLGWRQEVWPPWFPVLVFLPFVADATVTLGRRLIRGERVWQAHRSHYYQRLVRLGWSHRRLALVEAMLMLACAGSALALRTQPGAMQGLGLVAWLAVLVWAMARVDRRWRNAGDSPGSSEL